MYRRPLTIAEAADLPLSMCALTITAEIGTNKESFQMQYITAKAMRRGARTRVNLLDGDKTRLQVQRFRVGAPQPAPRAPWFSFRPFESNSQDKREPDNLVSNCFFSWNWRGAGAITFIESSRGGCVDR